ncbi:Aste57867_5073 [Aphanomyces stellatus]|uniref:Aste57867_5073 protein n=1 Tax=Aphanomyces stellatus TaxID=120398 RepID=A0A485KEY0_9STRA|nr:hypothetical protein As57867_005060 [Aphanomyces stellatus]VFT82154.1 Aste57867_5073 [Aphanomyces stellatus]
MLGWRLIYSVCDCCFARKSHVQARDGVTPGAASTMNDDDEWSDEEEEVTFTAQMAPGIFAFTSGDVKALAPLLLLDMRRQHTRTWCYAVASGCLLIVLGDNAAPSSSFFVLGPTDNAADMELNVAAALSTTPSTLFLLTVPLFNPTSTSLSPALVWPIPSGPSTVFDGSVAPSYVNHVVASPTDGGGSKPFVEVVVLDESLLVSIGLVRRYDVDFTTSCLDQCQAANTSTACPTADAQTKQLNWLNETLRQSHASWLFVVGQRPLCLTDHGGPYDYIHDTLASVLRQHQVDAYFATTDVMPQVKRVGGGDASHPSTFYQYSFASVSTALPSMDTRIMCESVMPNATAATTGVYSQHVVTMKSMDVTLFDSLGHVLFQTTHPRRRKAFEDESSDAYIPWVASAAVLFTATVAIVYGLKFKGKNIDYSYDRSSWCCCCCCRIGDRLQSDQCDISHTTASQATQGIPMDADDDDDFEMDMSSGGEDEDIDQAENRIV